jgi:hypothetical protein
VLVVRWELNGDVSGIDRLVVWEREFGNGRTCSTNGKTKKDAKLLWENENKGCYCKN